MAKVTSKLQVTIPKAVADRLGIRPGDQIDWRVEGGAVRIAPSSAATRLTFEERRALFEEAMQRQQVRNQSWWRRFGKKEAPDRDWTREELYTRGRPR
jgi:AbrB family looped-hinge helix DNA binding protein